MEYLKYIEYIKGHIKIGIKKIFIKVYYIEFPSRIRIFPSRIRILIAQLLPIVCLHDPSDTLRTWNMVPPPEGGNVILDEFFK